MPWRLNQASGFRQQGKYNRTSAAERSEIRREAVRPLPLQDTPPYPGLAHPGFHSKSSFVFFPVPSHQPMENDRVIPEEPKFYRRVKGNTVPSMITVSRPLDGVGAVSKNPAHGMAPAGCHAFRSGRCRIAQ